MQAWKNLTQETSYLNFNKVIFKGTYLVYLIKAS